MKADLAGGHEMQHLHNLWLEIPAESGMLALIAFMGFCVARWTLLIRCFVRRRGPPRRLAAVWLALEAALLVASLQLYMLKHNSGMLTWFIWGYILMTTAEFLQTSSAPENAPSP
jgi:O-antigen ligase